MTSALEGFRILDLSHALAGPSATKLLGDFGAEVIKVEVPERGDFTRSLVPWVFESFNRNKKSIAINLKSQEGQELVRELARNSDVIVQSFRPGVVEAMNIGRADMKAVNPRLIYVSFSGFGEKGADANRRGVDPLLQAETGLALIQGRLLESLGFIDAGAGLALCGAIIASLLKRERTGEVDHIDMSLFDAALYLQSATLLECSTTGEMVRQSERGGRFPLNGIFDAEDGPFYMGVFRDADWVALCDLAGESLTDIASRFATVKDRSSHCEELVSVVAAILCTRARREWIDGLERRGVIAGEVRTHQEVLNSDQVKLNDSVEYLRTSRGVTGAFVRNPTKITGSPRIASTSAPSVGEHSDAIMESIGISAERRKALHDSKIVN